MATVTSSKRHLQLTSDTYESNGVVTIGGDNLYFDGSNTYLRSDNQFRFLTDSGAAQLGKFKSLQVSTSYSGTPPDQGILFGTDTNLYRSAANTLKTDDNLEVGGGSIVLGGTGRIQGIDTVSANTDAANKLYVDNHDPSTDKLPLAGGTMAGSIAMANYNITGVNQLEFNDPGEGIVFKQGSSGDISLVIVDDSNDNILRLSGTGAQLQIGTNRVLTTADEGPGNGLDADTLDGNHASAFFKKGTDIGGSQNLNNYTTDGYYHQNSNANATSGTNYPASIAGMLTVTSDGVMVYQTYQGYGGNSTYERKYYNGTWEAWHTVWDSGNDGAGSGLNADLLDGNHASAFALSTHTHAASDITSGTFADARIALSNITQHTDSKYLRSNANDNFSGQLVNNSLNETPAYNKGAINLQPSTSGGSTGITFRSKVNSTSDAGYIWWYDDNDHYNELNSTENGVLLIAAQNDGGATSEDAIAIESSGDIYLNPGVASGAIGSGEFNSGRGNIYLGYAASRNRILTTADEGSGNGLDADTLDGNHASAFALSSHTHAAGDITSGTFAAARMSATTRYNIGNTNGNTSSSRDKLRLYNDGNYTIGFQSGVSYGHINSDWAMTFQMNNDADRGWWFGDTGHSTSQGAAMITTEGKMVLAKSLSIGEGETVTSPSSTPLYLYGSGSTVLDIQGSQGQLFSITDDLTGDLFSVSDISGIPILNVNASGDSYFDGNVALGDSTLAGNAAVTVSGSMTFGIPGNGSNTNGRYISIEGNADSSGEGSGRIFFTEHNSSTTSMDAYGMSIGYRGGGTTITGASGNSWTGLSSISNGQWGMWGHDNNADGALIMYGDRGGTFVDFAGNNIQGITDIYVADQILHTGDTNTYMQFHAADQWRVVTGGGERLEVNNSATTLQNKLVLNSVAATTTGTTGLIIDGGEVKSRALGSNAFNSTAFLDAHPDTSTLSGTYGSTSNGTKIDQITVDSNGHITAITTGGTGDINGVTAGTGLSGGGTSGTPTLNSVYLPAVDDRDVKPTATGIVSSVKAIKPFFTTFNGMTGTQGGSYLDMIALDTYSDSSAGGPNAITFHKDSAVGSPIMHIWKAAWNGTTWGTGQRVFADNYHPNADKWTTARTLTLSGDVTGTVTFDGSGAINMTNTAVANDSHTHDGRYYTESESNTRYLRRNASNDVDIRVTATDGRGLRFWDSDNYKIYMSATSNGTWGGRVGNETTSDYNMYFRMVGGTNRGFVFRNGTNNMAGIDASGNGRFEGDVIAYSSSDRRYKDNLLVIGNATDKIKQLSGYEFTWNDKQTTYKEGTKDVGVVAQEVEKILPEVVTTRQDGYKAVKYEKIVPLLIEGIKEQQKQIDELKAIVNKLQNEK